MPALYYLNIYHVCANSSQVVTGTEGSVCFFHIAIASVRVLLRTIFTIICELQLQEESELW